MYMRLMKVVTMPSRSFDETKYMVTNNEDRTRYLQYLHVIPLTTAIISPVFHLIS